MWGRNWKKMHIIFFIYIFLFRGKRKGGGGGGSALNIFSIFYTHHRIPNKHMMTINFDTITNNYEVIYVIKTVMKYHLKKIDTSFHQPLPNMVQRLFADVINDAIWFMNIHEQNHPWFLAMILSEHVEESLPRELCDIPWQFVVTVITCDTFLFTVVGLMSQ